MTYTQCLLILERLTIDHPDHTFGIIEIGTLFAVQDAIAVLSPSKDSVGILLYTEEQVRVWHLAHLTRYYYA